MSNDIGPVVNVSTGDITKQKCDVCGNMVTVLAMKFSTLINRDNEYFPDVVSEFLPYFVNHEYGICYRCLFDKLGVRP
jgi:hypothetical protein